MLPTVTQRFIEGILREGRLTEARKRFENGSAHPADWNFDAVTCWNLVCEEVVDTDHDPDGYDAVYAELAGRGFTPEEVDEMRGLAWKSAGWLNYDMMLWDWVNLDENDMRKALELQWERRLIRWDDYDTALLTIRRFLDRDPEEVKLAVRRRLESGK